MSRARDGFDLDGVPFVRLESEHHKVDVVPGIGGRVLSLVEKRSSHEFLWRNAALRLEASPHGSEYDPHFFGGIDELLPNDMPESVDGQDLPDHGELWTTALNHQCDGETLRLSGTLPRCGLVYEREMSLPNDRPCLDFLYRITNHAERPRVFLWKLHAALAVDAGDVIDCPARLGQVVDLAWSRYRTLAPFDWPKIEGQVANVVPAPDGTVDFFYLFELAAGRIGWHRPGTSLALTYQFDPDVFPYAWLFASYGGFNGHYTVVLEPCTAMPISLKEAAGKGHCSRLSPGQSLVTKVSILVGPALFPAPSAPE